MGYDVIVKLFKTKNIANGASVKVSDTSPDWYMVVNPGVLTICRDNLKINYNDLYSCINGFVNR